MEAKLNLKLISHTPDPEILVATAASLCYSDKSIDEIIKSITLSEAKKLITMLDEMGHDSVFEHVSFTFGIEGVSRILLAQLTRHRVASYCLSGDTVLLSDRSNGGVRKKTIKQIYEMKPQYRKMLKIRCVDESNSLLTTNSIKSVIRSGIKKVYKVTTKNGYTIKSTHQHRFYTEDGWKQLSEIKPGDFVYTNGIPLYKNKEWLNQKYNIDNLDQESIGILCNVSKHTIRSWVKKHKLQKEMGSWSIGVSPQNKGKNKYNYEPMRINSEKRIGKKGVSKPGTLSPSYKHNIDDLTVSGGYFRTHENYKKNNICCLCSKEDNKTEIHHKDKNTKNYKDENLIELCITCHKIIHRGHVIRCVQLSKIISIEYCGEEDTYDIEMEAPHHNFAANGFIVHNSVRSQRYVSEIYFSYVIPEDIKKFGLEQSYIESMERNQEEYNCMVDALMFEYFIDYIKYRDHNKYNEYLLDKKSLSFDCDNYLTKNIPYLKGNKLYNKFLKRAIENSRYLLPGACETKIIMTINARSLFNLISLRSCFRAQNEIWKLIIGMIREVKKIAPNIFANSGPECLSDKCKQKAMSCGRQEEIKKIIKGE